MDYRLGFFIILAIFAVTGVTAGILFDRTIANYMHLHTAASPSYNEYAYLDPTYYSNVTIPPPLAYERHVHSLDDFAAWRDMLVDPDFHISNNPHPAPKLIDSTPDFEKFLLGEIIVYHAPPPPNKANGKAVLVIPGSGNGAAREIMGIKTQDIPYHGKIGLKLAAAGYDAYTLELDGWGQRQKYVGGICPTYLVPHDCEYFSFKSTLAKYGINLDSIHDREVATALSYMASKYDWIAVSGLSGGAKKALSAALTNPDVVDAAIVASGVTMVHEWPMSITMGDIEKEYTVENVDRLRALAPMPLYVSYGIQEKDSFGYAAKSEDIQGAVQSTYEMHDATEAFSYVVHDGMHEYDIDSVIAFLDSY